MNLLEEAAWHVLATTAGAIERPEQLPSTGEWLSARVPGTAAEALRRAGRAWSSVGLDGQDWWWRATVDIEHGPHEWILRADGLATIADVWVGGHHVLHSRNMFRSHCLRLTGLPAQIDIVIRCAAALPLITARHPRPRWKSTMVEHQGWRWFRTSLLGRVSAWSGSAPAVGPWRALSLSPVDRPTVVRHRIRTRVEGGAGVVRAELQFVSPTPIRRAFIRIDSTTVDATIEDDRIHVEARLPNVRYWWPHTYGRPDCYRLEAHIDGNVIRLPDVGFRTIAVDRTAGKFALHVNGTAVFARGACWMPLDPVSMRATRDELRSALEAARDAGFTMIRVPGGTLYESDEFYDLCSTLGLMVWQDVMLATLDPPTDPDFTADLTVEVEQLADRIACRPCVVVLCGGSETEQQSALLGLAAVSATVPAISEAIPATFSRVAVDIPYVTSTPSGGFLPTDLATGIAHYFGIGAYLRPLSDVRNARVRFATECLAVSIPPEANAVNRWFGSARVAGHDPAWKEGVPRDRSASWDAEDVRDHYVAHLFDVNPMLERRSDPERYLDLGRAAVCVAMEEVFTQWRRPASSCDGGLVWTMRDLRPGAGWGLMDHAGNPKAPFHVLRRSSAPLAILVSDDGLDGIALVTVNDGPETVTAELEATVWSVFGTVTDSGRQGITIPGRSGLETRLDAVIGSFTDANHSYGFGPRIRDVLHVRLTAPDGSTITEHVALMGHHLRPMNSDGLRAVVYRDADGWVLQITATRTAQWVVVSCDEHQPSDSWFHMRPSMVRHVRLIPAGTTERPPRTSIRALNIVETTAETRQE